MIDDEYLSRSRDLTFSETLRRDGYVDWELEAWLSLSGWSEAPEGDEPADFDPVIVRAIDVEVDLPEEARGGARSLDAAFEFLSQNAGDVTGLFEQAADDLRIGLRPDVTPFLLRGTVGGHDALLRVMVLNADAGRAVAGRLRGLTDRFADILREMRDNYHSWSRSQGEEAAVR